MPTSKQQLRLTIFVNILAIIAWYNGKEELAAVIVYAGLCNFQTYLITKNCEIKHEKDKG